MWDNPDALNRLSALILVLTLLFAGWIAMRQATEAWLPIQSVEVRGASHDETRARLRSALAGLSGGLFSADLEAAQLSLESLPWVRTATVRRLWPNQLVVELEEHKPAASWNDLAMLNSHGEAFPVRPLAGLPRFMAPEGMEKEVAMRFAEFALVLGDQEIEITGVRVDERHAWEITLADGVTVDLGRERLNERLRRFVTFYPMAMARMAAIRRVDMRYPNGFAVRGDVRT